MRRIVVPLLALSVLLIPACSGSDPGARTSSSASCVGPQVAVTPAAVGAGGALVVTGTYFAATCNDTGVNGVEPRLPEPLHGLTLLLRQDGRTWTLADGVDAAGPSWSFEVPVRLPGDVQPGPAEVLVDGYSRPVPIQVP